MSKGTPSSDGRNHSPANSIARPFIHSPPCVLAPGAAARSLAPHSSYGVTHAVSPRDAFLDRTTSTSTHSSCSPSSGTVTVVALPGTGSGTGSPVSSSTRYAYVSPSSIEVGAVQENTASPPLTSAVSFATGGTYPPAGGGGTNVDVAAVSSSVGSSVPRVSAQADTATTATTPTPATTPHSPPRPGCSEASSAGACTGACCAPTPAEACVPCVAGSAV